jgi:hypothetical protein
MTSRNWKNLRLVTQATALLVIASALTVAAHAQADADKAAMLQKLKDSAAANKQQLHQYTWTETQQITMKGEAKPSKEFQCQYGPDGRVQKTPMGAAPAAPESGGRRGGMMKQRIIEKKTEEMKDYMQKVQTVVGLYVPPEPERMQKAVQAGNFSINPTPGTKAVDLTFKNYALTGDELTISFDTEAKKMQGLKVNTYVDDPKDAVGLVARMDSLPDGTNYAQQTRLDVASKELEVTTTSSNFAKRVP